MQRKKERPSRKKNTRGSGPIETLKRLAILLMLIVAGAVFYEMAADRPQEQKPEPEVSRPLPKSPGGKKVPTAPREPASGEAHRAEPREPASEEAHRAEPREPIYGEAPRTEPRQQAPREKPRPVPEAPAPAPGKIGEAPPVRVSGVRIAIIIDDIGADLSPVRKLLEIDAPINFAVLPHTPRSVAAANLIHQAGRDVLLHLPMEPQAYPKEKPGPGSLFTSMDAQEIRQTLNRNLNVVPFVSGVNNHMGSRFTEDGEKLAIVMEELKKKGLFFVDSRTTPRSKGGTLSREMGVPFAARRIFIDNEQDYNQTCRNLLEVLASTRDRRQDLVLIGHPHATTVSALTRMVPELKSRGVEIVSISRLVR